MKVILELKGYPTKYGGVQEVVARDDCGNLYYCAFGIDDNNEIVCDRVRLAKHKDGKHYVLEGEHIIDIENCSVRIEADLLEGKR